MIDFRSGVRVGGSPPPIFDNIDRWFHPETLFQLCSIKGFIDGLDEGRTRTFLRSCFSSCITLCTGRRGEQHGFFADNAALPSGQKNVPYRDAVRTFLDKTRRAISATERLYSVFQRQDADPKRELARIRVVKADARALTPHSFGLKPASVAGIITSPPYLCMSDYALGQRLSYEWLFPGQMAKDFGIEIGARRTRFRPEIALEKYLVDMELVGRSAANLLRPGGMMATVLGAPVARPFLQSDVLEQIHKSWIRCGFRRVWTKWRPIHWHRNHGYSKLKRELISVYALER